MELWEGFKWRDVAPLVGAWIEMRRTGLSTSGNQVAPLVGAWIEIVCRRWGKLTSIVAPLVGAWIEMPIWSLASTI